MTRLIAAALLAGTTIAAPATATPIYFDFVATDGRSSSSFTVDTDQVISSIPRVIFFDNVLVTTPTFGLFGGSIAFYGPSRDGGFAISDTATGNVFSSSAGPQLYSGQNSNPVFSSGIYALSGSTPGLLTISNVSAPGQVPEPATWAMMMLGFGAIGYAMRRKTVLRFV